MPRINTPGLTAGSGAAPAKTVEDSSLRYPQRDTDPLKAHLNDPQRAHMAASIGIVDAGDYYTSNNVEGALQEIGAEGESSRGGRQNGWLSAGTSDFTTAVTTSGPDLLLVGSWVATTNIGVRDVSGSGYTLTGPDGMYWVYLDADTGLLAQSTGAPDISNDEHILVGLFELAGGNIVSQADARFFVRNDNRKIVYTVRADGPEVDANSEGAFATLEAAFLWINTYSTTTTSRKTRITLRGQIVVTSSLDSSVPGLEVIGEDGAEIVLSASNSAVFNLNTATNIRIENITFVCNGTNNVAITTSGMLNACYVTNCRFIPGTSEWFVGVFFQGSGQDLKIRECYFEDVTQGVAAFVGSGDSVDRIWVEGNTFHGVSQYGIALMGAVQQSWVLRNSIDCRNTTTGASSANAIHITEGDGSSGNVPSNITVSENTVWGGYHGIYISGLPDVAAQGVVSITNFANLIPGSSTISITNAATDVLVLTAVSSSPGSNEFLIGVDNASTAANLADAINTYGTPTFGRAGINSPGVVGFISLPAGEIGNSYALATNAPTAISLTQPTGGFDGLIRDIYVTSNSVYWCNQSYPSTPPMMFDTFAAFGIGASNASGAKITENAVVEVGIEVDLAGVPSIPNSGGPVANAVGITAWNLEASELLENTVLNTTGNSEALGVLWVVGGVRSEPNSLGVCGGSRIDSNTVQWVWDGKFAQTPGASPGQIGILAEISTLPGDASGVRYILQGMSISSNTTSLMSNDGIILVLGDDSEAIDTLMQGNSVSNSFGDGITIAIRNGAVLSTGVSAFTGTMVQGNSVSGCGGRGISIESSRTTGINPITGLVVQANQIHATRSYGLVVATDFATGSLSGIQINNNHLTEVSTSNPTEDAIYILASSSTRLAGDLAGITVSNNQILNSGNGLGCAVAVDAVNRKLDGVVVVGNVIGTPQVPVPLGGVRVSTRSTSLDPATNIPDDYPAFGVVVSDNNMSISGVLPSGFAEITVSVQPSPGDVLRFPFGDMIATAAAPGPNEYQIGGNTTATASNLAAAINSDPAIGQFITAQANGNTIRLDALDTLPGSFAGFVGPIQSSGTALTITPFTGTGVASGFAGEFRARFTLTSNYTIPNPSWPGTITPGDTFTLDAPGQIASETFTFVAGAPGPFQIEIGATPVTSLANLISSINTDSNLATASLYSAVPNSCTAILTASPNVPGRLGNYLRATWSTSGQAFFGGAGDGYFAYGNDNMVNGVSINTHGTQNEISASGNKIAFNNSVSTLNRRGVWIRAYSQATPFSIARYSDTTLEVDSGVNVLTGNQTFTINDGVFPALTFQYLERGQSPTNPAFIPVVVEPSATPQQVRDATVAEINKQTSARRFFVLATLDASPAVMNLFGPAVATTAGSISVSNNPPLVPDGQAPPITTGNWNNGVAGATYNPFRAVENIAITGNQIFGGCGSQIEILNGHVSRNISMSNNNITRDPDPTPDFFGEYNNPGYYYGLSMYHRSAFASAQFSVLGAFQAENTTVDSNVFSNLDYGAVSVYKSMTRNNLAATINTTRIASNTVTRCGMRGIGNSILAVEMQEAKDIQTPADINTTITDNQIFNCTVYCDYTNPVQVGTLADITASHILTQSLTYSFGLDITQNSITNGSATTTFDGEFQIACGITSKTGQFAQNWEISNNEIAGVDIRVLNNGGGIAVASHIFVGSPAGPNQWYSASLLGLNIDSNNLFDGAGRRFVVGGTAYSVATCILNWQVQNCFGISYSGNTISASNQGIPSPAVPGNFAVGSILHFAVDAGSVPPEAGNIGVATIGNNRITTTSNVTAGAIQLQASLLGVGLHDNKIVTQGTVTAGIVLGNEGFFFPVLGVGVTLTGNSVVSTTNNAIQAFVVGLDLGLAQGTFTGNTVSSPTGWLAGFSFGGVVGGSTATPLGAVTISGNAVFAVASAIGGAPASPVRGTCTGNVGAIASGPGSWDAWADNTGTPRVAVYRIGATPLNN
jgi:hypothetical protein